MISEPDPDGERAPDVHASACAPPHFPDIARHTAPHWPCRKSIDSDAVDAKNYQSVTRGAINFK